MRIWLDTEFLEDGRTIELISIGMVRESDGAVYYAETPNARDLCASSRWLTEHVLPHLSGERLEPFATLGERPTTRARADIAQDIIGFVGTKPEFWAYYADYDWVALCQLYGRMIDLPQTWPMYCLDLIQLADESRLKLPKFDNGPVHNALADALECRDRHMWALRQRRL